MKKIKYIRLIIYLRCTPILYGVISLKFMSNFYNINLEKIKLGKLKISIVGLGYVGLNLLIHLSKTKNQIYGIDKDIKKISFIKKGRSYINYISDNDIKKIKKNLFSNNYNSIKNSDVIIFCLPTPLKNNRPDLTYLKEACNESKNKIRKGQILILESTSYPGTTEDFLYKNLNLKRFKLGKNFFLGFSPEREDPETKNFL